MAALNSAVWSGGSFIYIPQASKLSLPLQAYFRNQRGKHGQFERTLIIADDYAEVQTSKAAQPLYIPPIPSTPQLSR